MIRGCCASSHLLLARGEGLHRDHRRMPGRVHVALRVRTFKPVVRSLGGIMCSAKSASRIRFCSDRRMLLLPSGPTAT